MENVSGKNPLVQLGSAQDQNIVSVNGLAKIFHRHPDTIKRAIRDGKLPRPVDFIDGESWTVKSIIEHLQARLDAEKERAKSPV